MLDLISKYLQDTSVLRRLLFAIVYIPQDLPNYWGVALEFAVNRKDGKLHLTSEQVQMLVENLHELDAEAFATDRR